MPMMQFPQTDIYDLKVGDSRLFTKTLSDTDAMLYAGISGDMSPLFLNEEFAAQTEEKTRTVHPMLVASLLGGAMYRFLKPAVKTISRTFNFLAPVYAGDTVTVRLEIQDIDPDTGRITLKAQCFNQYEEPVLEGTCIEELVRTDVPAEH